VHQADFLCRWRKLAMVVFATYTENHAQIQGPEGAIGQWDDAG